jgi:hypothetical protein
MPQDGSILGMVIQMPLDVNSNKITSVATPTTGSDAANKTYADAIGTHIGMIVGYGGTGEPYGWLACSGGTPSRTTYAALFAVIGTKYGAGDGSTTFTLPAIADSLIRAY